jgi:hypothetical protein
MRRSAPVITSQTTKRQAVHGSPLTEDYAEECCKRAARDLAALTRLNSAGTGHRYVANHHT